MRRRWANAVLTIVVWGLVSVAHATIYHSLGDFSLTQGENQWYYLAWDETLEEYIELTPVPGASVHEDTWQGEGVMLRPIAMNPAPGFSAVRAWEAPADGTVHISHVKRLFMGIPCNGDGVDAAFYRNDTVIWGPAHIDPQPLKEEHVSLDVTTAVNAGDRIYCRVSETGTGHCAEPIITFRIGFVEDHVSGTTYIHFDDNSASHLLIPNSLTNSGAEWSAVSEGMGHLNYNSPEGSLAAWDGDLNSGGGPLLQFSPPVSPLSGDFTAQILFLDVSQLTAVGDAAQFGLGVVPTGGADGGGTGTYSVAAGCITRLTTPEGGGLLNDWTATQVGLGWDYVIAGEPMTATERVALRYVRTGDTLSLYAAYDDDAPPQGNPSGGTFHLVNSQTISGPVQLYVAMYSAVVSASVDFDDVYITGPMVPNYTSPTEDPGAGLPIRIENSTNIANSPELIFDVAWSHDGKKIAYLAAPGDNQQAVLKVFDLVTQETVTLADFETGQFIRGLGLTWSSDDQFIYYVSFPEPQDVGWGTLSRCSATIPNQTAEHVTRSLVTIEALDEEALDGGVLYPATVLSGGVPKLLFNSFPVHADYTMHSVIYAADLDPEGNPTLPATPLTDFGAVTDFGQCVLSPLGDSLLVCRNYGPTDSQLYLFTEVDDIINGTTEPIAAWHDPRVIAVGEGRNYLSSPSFSQDGTIIFYSKDVTGRYWHGLNDGFSFENYYECDFDIMMIDVSDALLGGSALRLPKWGNQMGLKASGGGTRVAWTEAYHTGTSSSVYAATVRLIDTASLSGGVLQADSILNDGSGTRLTVAADTVLTGADPGATSIDFSVFTPISPIEEALLGDSEVPVVRDFEPTGITFDPPAQLRFTYTDAEIRNFDEETLHVVWMHDGEPQFLDILDIDCEANHVLVEVPGFSEFGLTDGASDLDGDGLTNEQETMDLDPDTPGIQNPFDPGVKDSTGDNEDPNPDGIADGLNDWDGDGMRNAEEFLWGYDPLDPVSYALLPGASTVAHLVAIAVLLMGGTFIIRGSHCVRPSHDTYE